MRLQNLPVYTNTIRQVYRLYSNNSLHFRSNWRVVRLFFGRWIWICSILKYEWRHDSWFTYSCISSIEKMRMSRLSSSDFATTWLAVETGDVSKVRKPAIGDLTSWVVQLSWDESVQTAATFCIIVNLRIELGLRLQTAYHSTFTTIFKMLHCL